MRVITHFIAHIVKNINIYIFAHIGAQVKEVKMLNHEKDKVKTAQTRYRERQRRKGRERICFWLDADLAEKAKKLAILQDERPGTIFAEIFAAGLTQKMRK